MKHYLVISRTTGATLACVLATWHTEALVTAFELFPRVRVAVLE